MGSPRGGSPKSPAAAAVVSRRGWSSASEVDDESSSDDEAVPASAAAEREKRLMAALPPSALEQPLYCLTGSWAVQQQFQGLCGGLRFKLDVRHDPPQVRGKGEIRRAAPWRRDMRISLFGTSSTNSPIVRFAFSLEPVEDPLTGRREAHMAWRADCVVVVDATGNYFAGTYHATTDGPGRAGLGAGAIAAARLPPAASEGSHISWPPRPCETAPFMICERANAQSPPQSPQRSPPEPAPADEAPPAEQQQPAEQQPPPPQQQPGAGDEAAAPPAVPRRPSGPPSGRPGRRPSANSE